MKCEKFLEEGNKIEDYWKLGGTKDGASRTGK